MWVNVIFIIGIVHALHSTKLDLSFSGLTKEKFFRDSNGSVTSRVEKAKELNLRGNLFDSFADCSARLDKLEVLDLSQNQLQRFYFVCKNEDVLYKLNVSHNRLSFLNDTALTKRISKLQILDLSFNELQHITDQSFQHLTSLHFLKMNANPIFDNIEPRAFRNLISLVNLDMSNTSSVKFPADLFAPLVSLKYLKLAFNPLEELPGLPAGLEQLDISGTNIVRLEGLDGSRLTVLTMNFMPKLESLDLNQLEKLQNLTHLSIENCPRFKNLTAQPPPRDKIVPLLSRLSLRNCSLDNIPTELQPIMQRISELNLQENPWHCDCTIHWILSLNSTKSHSDEMRCKTPVKLREKRMSEIPADEYECSYPMSDTVLFILIGLGCLTVSAIATILYCVTKGPLRFWRPHLRREDTVTYKNIITRTNNESEKILDQCDITDYP